MKKIPLGGKKGKGLYALVDDIDYEILKRFTWFLTATGHYAETFTSRKSPIGKTHAKMEQVIMWKPKGSKYVIDHINGNRLDNRRSNLRICTYKQNGYNTGKMPSNSTGYKGVWKNDTSKTVVWVARVRKDGIQHNIGRYKSPIAAARAYDKKAEELFGEYARLNFPKKK